MLLMGWDGTEVVSFILIPPDFCEADPPQTPQIRSLIEDHHLGSIILTAKNLKCN